MQNGKLTAKELAPVFHPTLKLFLGAGEPAASWNTMRLFFLQKLGKSGDIYAEGPLGSYRDFAGQVQCKAQFGKNAATPGQSNHGLGRAVDCATHAMADLVDQSGAMFGWHHWDAKWEWWHREYDGGFTRPDPGPDEKNPVLRKGSGGPGQKLPVTRLQRALNQQGGAVLLEDGDFGEDTRKALVAFQKANNLTGNGVTDVATWTLLQQAPTTPVAKPSTPTPKPAPTPAAAPELLRGFDVSDARGDVDFAKARAGGIAFASVRIADGDIHDVRYGPGRINALRASGLAWFPYYFGRVASAQNAQRNGAAEAAMAIGFAKAGGWGKKGDLPLAYDFENANGQPPQKCARHLVQFVRAYRTDRGHCPIIYTMPGFWAAIQPQLSPPDGQLVATCPLWIAHWEVPDPGALEPWKDNWILWQDSDHGTVAGVASKCDTDRFRGGIGDFAKLIVT